MALVSILNFTVRSLENNEIINEVKLSKLLSYAELRRIKIAMGLGIDYNLYTF